MKNLYTERLTIRNFTIDDYRDLQEIIISKEASKYALYDHKFPTSLDEVKEINEKFSKGDKFLAVCESTEQKVIGFFCLNEEKVETLDLGFCFNASYARKGYTTEACVAVINYAFNTLQVERLGSGTANVNVPARRLLERLNFSKEMRRFSHSE